LVVEDDQQLRHLYRLELELLGYHVEVARDGLEALELLEKRPLPNLVVLDLLLPRVGGLAVTQELRSNKETRDIPVIVVTGASEPFDADALTQVLRKPIDAHELAMLIDGCLQGGDKSPMRAKSHRSRGQSRRMAG
jgi:CheY-like chemotaxis protein